MYQYLALAAIQIWSGYQNADIIRKNGELQANIDAENAKYAENDAYNAERAGESKAAKYQAVVNQTQGAMKTAYASQNVQIGYGTAGDVERDNRMAGIVNTLTIQKNARDTAMGFRNQAINLTMSGQMKQLQSDLNASSAQGEGILKAAGTAVTGYTNYVSTGRGNQSRSGTSDQAWKVSGTDMEVNPRGNGFSAPGGDGVKMSAIDTDGEWRDMSYHGDRYWVPGRNA